MGLVVESDRDTRRLLRDELQSQGLDVVEAEDGLQAIDALRRGEIDLTLTELRVAGVDGLRIVQTTKSISPDTEVVVVTAHPTLKIAIACMRAGASDLLEKPCSSERLHAAIVRALEHRRARPIVPLAAAARLVLFGDMVASLPARLLAIAQRCVDADAAALVVSDVEGRLRVAFAEGNLDLPAKLDELGALRAPVVVPARPAARPVGEAAAELGLPGRPGATLYYPMRSGDRLVGVLCLMRLGSAHAFKREEIDRLSIVVALSLLALENQRLGRETLRADRFSSAAEIAAGIVPELEAPVATLLEDLEKLIVQISALSRRGALRPTLLPLVKDAVELISSCREMGGRIRDVLSDVRGLGRSDHAEIRPIDLDEAIRTALRIVSSEFERRATIVTRFGGRSTVAGNRGQLAQVFARLLVGGARSADPSAIRLIVTITTAREGDTVIAEISHAGRGATVSEPRAGSPPLGSAGDRIDVAFCREVVERHRGTLDFHASREATAVRLTLPAAGKSSGGSDRPGVGGSSPPPAT